MSVSDRTRRNVINEFCDVLKNRYYGYTEIAVEKIVDNSFENKKVLYEIFSKHPNWDEEKLLIQFDQDYERNLCLDELQSFIGFIEHYLREGTFTGREFAILQFMREKITKTFFDESMDPQIDYINGLNENFHLRNNMKSSKAIGKICREEGWDDLGGTYIDRDGREKKTFDRRYAAACDCLNPIKVKRHTCIFINPIDFLLMSNGTSWESCHNIGDFDDHGCYSSGTISYMLDEHSFIFYTVDAEFDGKDIELEKKIQRSVFAYNDEVLYQSRLYPQSNDRGAEQIYTDIRNIVQKVVADCIGKPNLWVKTTSDVEDVVQLGYGATCYPDFQSGNPGSTHCSISTLKDRGMRPKTIVLGAEPICIYCGDTHDEENSITCCNVSDSVECDICGNRIDGEDAIWIHGDPYCSDCVEMCDRCGDYYVQNTGVYLDGEDSNVSPYCYTYNCGICSECEEEYFKVHLNYDEVTERNYCDDCYAELLRAREEAAANEEIV